LITVATNVGNFGFLTVAFFFVVCCQKI